MEVTQSTMEQIAQYLQTPNLDLRTFEQSNEYKLFLHSLPPVGTSIGLMYGPIPMIVDGDVKEIIIEGKNTIRLVVLYDVKGMETKYAQIYVQKDALKNKIRKLLMPNTHIRVKCTYATKSNNTFIAQEIESYNDPLLYGHYICPKCGYDYGFEKENHGDYCEICSNPLEYVTNFYKQ